jgi:N4-(beta-N-acetylglucosaminyl)-L-asparaginase
MKEEWKFFASDNHDTIGMIAIDENGNIVAGTSTNGANHKIPG